MGAHRWTVGIVCVALGGIALAGTTLAAEPSPWTGWIESGDGTLETYYRMGPLASDDDRLAMLALRCDPFRGASCGGDLLTTRDGLAWDIASILIPTPATLTGIARTGAGWVAVGSTPDQEAIGGLTGRGTDPVAWLSSDTESWRPTWWQQDDGAEVPRTSDGLRASGEMTGLAAGPAGLIAIGRWSCGDGCTLAPDGATGRAAMWRSDTGETWEPVDLDPAMPVPDAIGIVGDRYVIAGPGGFWNSPDGSSWTALDVDTGGSSIIGIASGPAGAVALGVDPPTAVERVTTWSSVDGIAWTAHDQAEAIDAYQLTEIRSVGDRFAIVGSGLGLWWSTDGVTWDADPTPWSGIIWDIGQVSGGDAVLVGQRGIAGDALLREPQR